MNVEESDTDDDLNTTEMLDKYANLDDSLRVDPDYEMKEVDEDSTDENESGSSNSDSDDGKTESQRKLNSEL